MIDYGRIISLSRKKANRREIPGAVSEEGANPVCGDRVKVFLKFEGGEVADASFTGEGCAISQASAALLVEHAKGKTREEIEKIPKDELLELLGVDLSKNPARLKCALLTLLVLKKAAQKG